MASLLDVGWWYHGTGLVQDLALLSQILGAGELGKSKPTSAPQAEQQPEERGAARTPGRAGCWRRAGGGDVGSPQSTGNVFIFPLLC